MLFRSSSFQKTITVDNATLVAGDTLTATLNGTSTVFTAVAGAPTGNQFQIGGTSTITASNLATTLTASGLFSSAIAISGVITLSYTARKYTFATSNTAALAIQSTLTLASASSIPSNITNSSIVDLLQTRSGHVILNMSIQLSASAVSGTTEIGRAHV